MNIVITCLETNKTEFFRFPITNETIKKEYLKLCEIDCEVSCLDHDLNIGSDFDELNTIALLIEETKRERPEFLSIVLRLINENDLPSIRAFYPRIKFLCEHQYMELLKDCSGIKRCSKLIQRHFDYDSFSEEFESSFETFKDSVVIGREIINVIAILPRNLEQQPFNVKF